jgi:deazaflavin-dependent oxidoreductase (nitroreductase family)
MARAAAAPPARRRSKRLQRAIEKYLTNPGMRLALRAGVAPRSFALLETTGNKTGRRRLTPVGNGLTGGTFWLVSELGLTSGYARNLQANPRVRVKVKRRWYDGAATILPDDDGWARREEIDRKNGLMGRFDGKIFRASATDPVTIRIDLLGGRGLMSRMSDRHRPRCERDHNGRAASKENTHGQVPAAEALPRRTDARR